MKANYNWDKFLHKLARTGQLTKACKTVKCTMAVQRKYRNDHPEFEELVQDALQEFVDLMESEAIRRAFSGYRQPLLYNGVVVAHKRIFSDALMIKILAARDPERYGTERREIKADVTVDEGRAARMEAGRRRALLALIDL